MTHTDNFIAIIPHFFLQIYTFPDIFFVIIITRTAAQYYISYYSHSLKFLLSLCIATLSIFLFTNGFCISIKNFFRAGCRTEHFDWREYKELGYTDVIGPFPTFAMIPKNSSTRRHIIQPLANDSRRIANDVGVQLLTFYTCTHLGSIAVGSYSSTMGFAQKKIIFFPLCYIFPFFFLVLCYLQEYVTVNSLKKNEICD